jgi:dihydropteroate synthase
MHIDKDRVQAIAKEWDECDTVLTAIARSVGDAGGDWAPAVRGAVSRFIDAWRADLARLAAEAGTIHHLLEISAKSYAITDEDAAQRMRGVQRSVDPAV